MEAIPTGDARALARAITRSGSSHHFDPDTMRFWRCRIAHAAVVNGCIIIRHPWGHWSGPTKWRPIRITEHSDAGRTTYTVTPLEPHTSLKRAITAARNHKVTQ